MVKHVVQVLINHFSNHKLLEKVTSSSFTIEKKFLKSTTGRTVAFHYNINLIYFAMSYTHLRNGHSFKFD